MALRQELINGAVDCRGRNGECAAPRAQHRHSGDPSLRVDEGTALASRMECKVKPDQAVDRAAATTMPSPARKGDDAERGERSALVAPDRHGHLTGTKRNVGDRRDWQSIRLKPKRRDISRRVSTRERGFDLASPRKRDLDVVVLLQRFFSGNDDTGTPMNST